VITAILDVVEQVVAAESSAYARSGWLSVGFGTLIGEMTRHTAVKVRLDPTVQQYDALARHAGAAGFAFNQCLAMVGQDPRPARD
jgi:Helix-turn-helix domain